MLKHEKGAKNLKHSNKGYLGITTKKSLSVCGSEKATIFKVPHDNLF